MTVPIPVIKVPIDDIAYRETRVIEERVARVELASQNFNLSERPDRTGAGLMT
jgi:hypothetical protein